MSQFRNQIHAAQLKYHAPGYPDDLAALLLPPKRNIWPLLVGTLVAGAAGAILAIVVINELVVPPPQRSEKVMSEEAEVVVAHLPGLPQMPQAASGLAAVGDQPVFLPALPSFPSLTDVLGGASQLNESAGENANARESL